MPRNPVKVKLMKLNPTAWPRFSCKVPPSRATIANGNTTAATSRPGSRKNFSRSRPARARATFTSRIFARQDAEVRVLQARGLGLQQRQRLAELLDDLVRALPVELDDKGAVLRERELELVQAPPQRAAVRRVDVQALLHQLSLDLARRAQRDDAAVVEDADAVGVLSLEQLMCGEADRDLVLLA